MEEETDALSMKNKVSDYLGVLNTAAAARHRDDAIQLLYALVSDTLNHDGTPSENTKPCEEEIVNQGGIKIMVNAIKNPYTVGLPQDELCWLLYGIFTFEDYEDYDDDEVAALKSKYLGLAVECHMFKALKGLCELERSTNQGTNPNPNPGQQTTDEGYLAHAAANASELMDGLSAMEPWVELYIAIQEKNCLTILTAIETGEVMRNETILQAVGVDGDLYGLLYEVLNADGVQWRARARECAKIVAATNISLVGMDLMRSMDMLVVAATADYRPNENATHTLLVLIKTAVDQLMGRFPWLGTWGDWGKWAMSRWRQISEFAPTPGDDGFTDDERLAVVELLRYEKLCATLVEYHAQQDPILPMGPGIIEQAESIISDINNPLKPGSEKPDSLTYRAAMLAMATDMEEDLKSVRKLEERYKHRDKRVRTAEALCASVVALFGHERVGPMWTGTSCAPGLVHFVQA